MKFSIWHALTVIILILLLGTSWYFFTQNQAATLSNTRLSEQKKSLEKEIEEINKQKQVVETEISDIKKEKELLITKINDFETNIQEMTASHEAKVKELSSQLDSLKATMLQKEEELKKVAEKDAEITFLRKIVKASRDKIDELTKQLGKTPQTFMENPKDKNVVNLPAITVTSAAKKVTGKVIDMNVDYDFVIISLGTKDGIKAGDTLFISNNKEFLGKVIVEKTRDSMSVAKLSQKAMTYTIQKGNTVTN